MTSTCSFSPQLSVLGFQSSAFSLITLPLKKDRIFSADQSAYVAGRALCVFDIPRATKTRSFRSSIAISVGADRIQRSITGTIS